MKKTRILLTLPAVALVSGLLFVSCPTSTSNSGGGGGGGGNTSGTYTAFKSWDDYSSTFTTKFGGTPPASIVGSFAYGTKSRAELLAACTSDSSLNSSKLTGITWSQATNYLQDYVDNGDISSETATQLKNKLLTDGYGLVGFYVDSWFYPNRVIVYAAFKE